MHMDAATARADTHDVISYSRGSRLSVARDPLSNRSSPQEYVTPSSVNRFLSPFLSAFRPIFANWRGRISACACFCVLFVEQFLREQRRKF